jgi:hypothetical protein
MRAPCEANRLLAENIVKSHVRAPLAEMKQAILDDVAAWRQRPATDDVSMVLVEVG